MSYVLVLLLSAISICLSDPIDQRKSEILVKQSGREVDPKGYLGDTATAKIPDFNHANIRYQGSKDGPLKGNSGSGAAERSDNNSTFIATYKDRQKGTAKVDKSKLAAVVTDSDKDTVNADVKDDQNVVAKIVSPQGKTTKVEASQIDSDSVTAKLLGDPNVYKVNGLAQRLADNNDILVQNANKPAVQEATKSVQRDSHGRITHLSVQEANEANKGALLGDLNKVVVDKSTVSNYTTCVNPITNVTISQIQSATNSEAKVFVGKQLGIVHDPNRANKFEFNGNCYTTTTEAKSIPCLPVGETDELNDDGYQVFNNIKWDYPPVRIESDGSRVFQFPGCFTVRVGVQIPRGTDKNDFGLQLLVYNDIVGLMQCDRRAECQDKQTANQPEPPCFHCNYCPNGHPVKRLDFGLESKTDFCSIVGGQRLNVNWTVCPPKETLANFKPFDKKLFGDFRYQTDVDVAIKVFHRERVGPEALAAMKSEECGGLRALLNAARCLAQTNADPYGLSWVLKACRRATMSYSLSCGLSSYGRDFTTQDPMMYGGGGN